MEEEAGDVLFKMPTVPKEVAKYEPPVDLDKLLDGLTLAKLQRIFDSVMRRQKEKIDPIRSKFGTIKREPISLETKIMDVMHYARKHRKFSFRQMLERQAGQAGSGGVLSGYPGADEDRQDPSHPGTHL